MKHRTWQTVAGWVLITLTATAQAEATPIISFGPNSSVFVPLTDVPNLSNFDPGHSAAAQTADGTLYIGGSVNAVPHVFSWNPNTGASLTQYQTLPGYTNGHIASAAIQPNGQVIFGGNDYGGPPTAGGRAVLWNSSGTPTSIEPVVGGSTSGAGISVDGRLVAHQNSGAPAIYDIGSGQSQLLYTDNTMGIVDVNNAGVGVGTNIWKPSNYGVALHGELDPLDAPLTYYGVSDSYIVGTFLSGTDATTHAAIWDVDTLALLHDFGAETGVGFGSIAEDDGVALISVLNQFGESTLFGWDDSGLFTPDLPQLAGIDFGVNPIFVNTGSWQIFGLGTLDGELGLYYLHAQVNSENPVVTPEPSTWVMMLVGLIFLLLFHKRFALVAARS